MENNLFVILFSLGNFIVTVVAVTISLRRSKAQNLLDGTNSIKNLQETVELMQTQHAKDRLTWEAELKKEKEEKLQILRELQQIKQLLKEAHLEIRIGVELGQEPKILGYEWATKAEAA